MQYRVFLAYSHANGKTVLFSNTGGVVGELASWAYSQLITCIFYVVPRDPQPEWTCVRRGKENKEFYGRK